MCPYSGKYNIQNHHHQRTARSLTEKEREVRSKRDRETVGHSRRFNHTRLFNFSVRNMSDTPMLRSRRQSDDGDVNCGSSNYYRLEVGCNSAKNMEFYSTCENKDSVTGEFVMRIVTLKKKVFFVRLSKFISLFKI